MERVQQLYERNHGLKLKTAYRYTHVTPYGFKLDPEETHGGESINEQGMKELLGQKKKYPELLEFFDKELSNLGEEKVLEKYAPVLLPGLVAALTHGIIHLGWALDFGSRRMLVEGAHQTM